MDFLDLARKRYSTRKYKKQQVEKEKIMNILEAARIAPSAANRQPWLFIVVENEPMLEQIRATYQRDWIRSAPVIIVICGDHKQSWIRGDGKDHCDIDAAIAIDHMTLAAAELGLGTCWVCHFEFDKCAKILDLPDHIEPIALLPLGYPDDSVDVDRHGAQRKKLEDIVRWE